MAVCGDISAVKADISCVCSGNDLDLSGYEILLLDAVLLEKDLQNTCLEDIRRLLIVFAGNSADDNIKVFSRNEIRCFLRHLLISEMRKKE